MTLFNSESVIMNVRATIISRNNTYLRQLLHLSLRMNNHIIIMQLFK